MDYETLASMPASKLHSAITKLETKSSKLTTALIEVGRGHEKYSDTAKQSDVLSVDYIATSDALLRLRTELAYRRKMHGKDTPWRYVLGS